MIDFLLVNELYVRHKKLQCALAVDSVYQKYREQSNENDYQNYLQLPD